MALLNRIIRASVLLAPQPADKLPFTNIGHSNTGWDTDETIWDSPQTAWDTSIILVNDQPIDASQAQ